MKTVITAASAAAVLVVLWSFMTITAAGLDLDSFNECWDRNPPRERAFCAIYAQNARWWANLSPHVVFGFHERVP